MWYMKLLHTNLVPDVLLRPILRRITRRKIRQLERLPFSELENQRRALLAALRERPIAVHTDLPNEQHYEVPPDFFQLVLGERLKYSCCYWPPGVEDLEEAEERMLDLTCRRAGLENGMTVLDLGCGWGSLTLWIAEKYPDCRVLAVSNSRDQVDFIREQARARGFPGVEARVVDVNEFALQDRFDRVFSIEMFEHMKNYPRLLEEISRVLKPGGRLFVHIFSHRLFAYEYLLEDEDNWMAQTFFTGGTMPSDDLLLHFQQDLVLVDHWRFSGRHYQKTLRAWLERMDSREDQVRDVLAAAYGPEGETAWWVNWRLFFMASEATWACRGGREYLVSHYLFARR